MNYRQMGKTGLRVSELCLGAMIFGRETTEEDSCAILDRFVEAGGNFIDTTDVYSSGKSEEILGRWLKEKNRADFVIATNSETRVSDAEKNNWGERWSIYANDRTWSVIDELLAIAGEVEKTPAQVALNWVLNRPGITAPIVGVRTMAHLQDNLGGTGWALSSEQLSRLDQASDQPLPYPYNLLQD